MDQIFITGLRLSAIIGCLPAEQDKEQPIIIDVIMNADCQKAAQTDDIAQAISYAAVAECIAHYVNNHRHKLVESLAEKLAELLLQQFAITQVTLKVGKPDALSYADNAGVQIMRKK